MMNRTARPDRFVLAAIVACALLMIAGTANALARPQQQSQLSRRFADMERLVKQIRGGASVDVDIESSDEEESETEDEEEEEAAELAKSTQKAASKTVKKAAATAMKASTPIKVPKKKSGPSALSKLKGFLRIPYILKAILNPVIFWQMTTGYWKSLYDINYMLDQKDDSSENLRSALEQKARYGPATKKKGNKKMKPGQAKTLSDLPKLNA